MSTKTKQCNCNNFNTVISCLNCEKDYCNECFVNIIYIAFTNEKCLYCDKTIDHSMIHCIYCEMEMKEEYIMEYFKEDYIKAKSQFIESLSQQTTETETSTEEIQECSICCDDCTESTIVTCNTCENTCCRNCFQRYILEKPDLSPVCMHDKCGKKLTIQNIIIATDKKWFETIYKPYRSDLLMKIETTKIKETLEATKVYQEAYYVLENKNYSIGIHENATICREVYGKGWEGFNFSANKPRPHITYKGFQFGCPKVGCLGSVIESVCNLCSSDICMECHEIIYCGKNHSCDRNTVESIKAVFSEARPCPKCSALISKIEGCDQMFCTRCHTTYSWNTGELLTGHVHNPHYFQWLDEQRKLLPVRINTDCQEFISYDRLINIFSMYQCTKVPPLPPMNSVFDKFPSIEHYKLAFMRIHANILHVRATSGNHANVQDIDNHELRVKLICEEIQEKEMKVELFKNDYNFHRYITYFHIYLLVFQTTGILFDNLWAYHHSNKKITDKSILKMTPIDYMHEIYFQIQKILEYGNDLLDYNNKCYGEDPLFIKFNRYPFQ